ncbi:MAG: sigma 54-interacting transcriptional regulator [Vicinamibacterales bacterium]
MVESNALEQVEHLRARGLYAAALATLDALPHLRSRGVTGDSLRVSLLERTGQHAEAEALAARLLRSKALDPAQRGCCEFALGLILWERGRTDDAMAMFRRSVDHYRQAGDGRGACWAELRLLVSLSGRAQGPEVATLLSQVRQSVVTLGEPTLSAALHIMMGELEAKRGLAAVASRHLALGLSLLRKTQHTWLEALAQNNLAALAIMRSDLPRAFSHAERSAALAHESGAAALIRAAEGNLGHICCLRGEYAQARTHLEASYHRLPSNSEHAHAPLDGLARTYLAEGQLDEADRLLSRIETGIANRADSTLYANRYALLTRVELLMRRGQLEQARALAGELAAIVEGVDDRSLRIVTMTRQAEIAGRLSGEDAAAPLLNEVVHALATDGSPSHFAEFEQTVGTVLRAVGRSTEATHHLARAQRIYDVVHHAAPASGTIAGAAERPGHVEARSAAARQLQEVAVTLMTADRPELVATGLLACIERTGCARGGRIVAAGPAGDAVLSAFGACAWPVDDPAKVRVFTAGDANGVDVRLEVAALPDIESQVTLDALDLLVSRCQALRRAEAIAEERLTLWPLDELPASDDDSVVMGRMKEVMLSARRVADSKVVVLITGESGTGKEVVARAIHRYSQRHRKPFVPFNCTAVPRDLIESHLFGFRRGAFTGADRDNPGLIRLARDGTLFLDEIGDLSLDLQPKLLRFLESGEIAPLGDSPQAISVHVVAATNADLKSLVEQGRFREDLYYRLNVYQIEIPPLRERREEIEPLARHFAIKRAHELGKGVIRLSQELIAHLLLHPWPGNVRQLSHEIGRMVAHAEPNQELTVDCLPKSFLEQTNRRGASEPAPAPIRHETLGDAVSRLEREMIAAAITRHHGQLDAAARALGLSRKGLYLKRQRYGL